MRKIITILLVLFSFSFNSAWSQSCNGLTTYTVCSGNFTDGSGAANYTDNVDCTYLIQPPGATSITLTWTSFTTEVGYDFVYVHDGANSAAPLVATYSGTSLPLPLTSTGGSLFLHFVSDGSYNFAGWSVSYLCAGGGGGLCSGSTTITSCSATVTDGSGTGNYIDNMNCAWVLNPTGTNQPKLHFTQFDTEPGYDELFVYDGTNDTGPLLLQWSGGALPSDVTASTGAMYVNFISDFSNTYGGFSATYSCITPNCSGTTNLTTCTGTISDGSGVQSYQDNLNCSWKIAPAGANYITLHFTGFNTYDPGDVVEVFDGPNASATLIGYYYGASIPADVVSSGSTIFIRFTTDGSYSAGGWSLNYTCNNTAPGCTGQTSLTNCNGTFADGSGTNDYLNNLNCSWLIHPASATSVSLHFNSFNTESNDFVTIYDGPTTASPSLGAYSGSFPPADITSSGGNMLVTFASNSASPGAGFDCSYTCNNGVGIADIDELLNFNVYPNPNDGTFKMIIEFNTPSLVNIFMTDEFGRMVKSWKPQVIGNRHSQKMEVSELANGVYILVAETNGRTYRKYIAVAR